MIYIIINQSYELGDPIEDRIDFVSTSLSDAEKTWDKYYSDYATKNSFKWVYSADLREYPDGYNIYSLKESEFKILKHVNSIGE